MLCQILKSGEAGGAGRVGVGAGTGDGKGTGCKGTLKSLASPTG